MFLSGFICLAILLTCGVVQSTDRIDENWRAVPGSSIVYITAGQAGVWGIRPDKKVIYRQDTYDNDGTLGDGWTEVDGSLYTQIDVGTNVVWGITKYAQLLVRIGITKLSPVGSKWVQIPLIDGLMQFVHHVSVSNNNHVWVIDSRNFKVSRRVGASLTNPIGDSWEVIPDINLKQISVGPSGVWGIDREGMIWHREGTFGDKDTSGTGWIQLIGKTLQYISSGHGVIYGIDTKGNAYKRSGITAAYPIGGKWVKIWSEHGHQIEAGENTVWLATVFNFATAQISDGVYN